MTDPTRPQVGISLKLYMDLATTIRWAREVVADLSPQDTTLVDMWVAPATPFLSLVGAALSGSGVTLAAQNADEVGRGAHTGSIGGADLFDIGCTRVVLGHAERRARYGEGDEMVARKAAAAVRSGLVPVVCVGEEREEGVDAAMYYVIAQASAVREVVAGPLTLAYEPVWAIGAQRPASTSHIRSVCTALRRAVPGAHVIYGGSAGPGLVAGLAGAVDGLFLGRFAHNPRAVHDILSEVAGALGDK